MKRVAILLCGMILPICLYSQEICDNGIDDDGDGWIDLNDPDCKCAGILTAVKSLIPNPSFEDTLCCPSNFSQMSCAESWIQASDATTDYLNLCGFTAIYSFFPPPLPLPGNGSGYAGFYNFGDYAERKYQEMIGACLDRPLKENDRYRFSLFVARAYPNVTPLALSIYGTPDCNDLPWEGQDCPVGLGSWMLLGSAMVEFPDSSWQHITIEFEAPADIYALAIGGPCGPVGGGANNYYYADELLVASVADFDFNARVSESGEWCTNDLQLHAAIDTVGGSWQWYRSGIALPGATVEVLNLINYYVPDAVYTAVYTLGGDCVSVDYTVEVDFFKDYVPDLWISPACKGFSNGVAVITDPSVLDSLGFSYFWRSARDTVILSDTDTLQHVPSGPYSLQIIANTGCDTLLFFDVPEEDFKVSFLPSDTLICALDTLQLINTSDSDFVAFYWLFGNGDSTFSVEPPPYVYREGGTYRVMLAGSGSICTDTAYGTIRVDRPIAPYFDLEPAEVCVGEPVYCYPHYDTTLRSLELTFAEQSHTESVLQHRYQFAFDQPGSQAIHVTFTSRSCPDTSYTDSIMVYALPEVDLGRDSSICLHGRQPLYLKNLREAPLTPYHQVWSTGDATEVLKVVHPGTYTLSVTTEPIGCTTTETIEIDKDCYIDIPNAFTPNGDGHNDYFLPRQLLSESLVRFHMQVLNRWGQLIFESTNLNSRGWDGRFNGHSQPMGVYLYRIEADFSNGRNEQYEGNVSLLR